MARRSGFRGSRQFPTQRRLTGWALGPDATPLALGTTAHQQWTNGVQISGEGQKNTLVRIRGMAVVFLTTLTSAGDGFDGALGIGLVSNEAFAAGVASQPGALTDADWDGWVWHSFFHVHGVTATVSDGVNANLFMVRIPIDSKAQRKWSEGYTLVGDMELIENGTAVGEMWADTRILLKLP